jgi:pyruvate kinase
MLETMQKNPRPTRAEVADVTNAVLEGADAVMLSGESANGNYPVESVSMQATIVRNAEEWAMSRALRIAAISEDEDPPGLDTELEGASAAACFLAERMGASAIVVQEDTEGYLTRAVSRQRPAVPIAAISDSIKVCRQLSISRSVQPVFYEHLHAVESAAELRALAERENDGLVSESDSVVIVRLANPDVGTTTSIEIV